MQDMLDEMRDKNQLADYFVVSGVVRDSIVEELQRINPSIRTIEEFEGVPIRIIEGIPLDFIFLLPYKGLL